MALYAIYRRGSTTPLQGKTYPNQVAAQNALEELNRQIAGRLRSTIGLEVRQVQEN